MGAQEWKQTLSFSKEFVIFIFDILSLHIVKQQQAFGKPYTMIPKPLYKLTYMAKALPMCIGDIWNPL